MLKVVLSTQFKKDLKIAEKRGYNKDKLIAIVNQLAEEKPLDEKFRDHSLKGKYARFRECHIEPDWLLIYRIDADILQLYLFRTGSHSDLF